MSTFKLTPQLMRAIIMDHYENPRCRKTPEDLENYRKINMNSSGCVDDIWVYLKVENEIVEEVYWEGEACAISTASTSIMCEMMQGKNIDDALYIIDEYKKMIDEQNYDESVLGEALVFMNTSKQPARIKCATLGWDGLLDLLKELEEDE